MEQRGALASADAQAAQKRLIGWLLVLITAVAGILYFSEEPFLGRPQSPYSFLFVILLTGAGFWYLLRGWFTVAVTIVNTCFFVAVAGPLLIHGLEAAAGLLPLLFVPLSLSSLVLTRRNTIVNAAATVIVFLGSLALQQSGITGNPDGLSPGELVTAGQFTIAFVVLSLILDRFGRTTSAALALSQSRERALVAEMEQRRGIESELQDERNFSDAIIAGLPGIFIVLDEHDKVLRGNDTIGEATGYGQDRLDQMPVREFVNPEERAFVRRLVEQVRHEGQGEGTIRLRRADGTLVPYLFRARSFIMNTRPYVVALGYDVSQIVEAERNIQELNKDLQATNLELRRAYDTTIEGWSRALELRDEETEGHSQRVTELTLELVRRMGVSDERLEHIRRGALLHDIGKMGVPDSILLKPGRLTAEERKVMEQHPNYARQLLQPIEFLRPALAIPYSHHEDWDGSGYPQGLSGEDIPMAARVFAVVDVYDALTSDRPYRKAWSSARALAHIREQAGRKFDPRVVEEFSGLMQETSDRH